MFKNRLLHALLAPFFIFADDAGGGGGKDDRGDNYIPPTDADDKAAAGGKTTDAEKAAEDERLAAELAAKGKDKDAGLGAAKAGDKDDKDDKDDKGAKKDTRIPLARHTEILNRERAAREAAELEVSKLKEGQQAAKTNEELGKLETQVVEKEGKYAELLAEGNTKEAAVLMREIRTLERSIIEQKAEFRTQVATANAVEQVRFDAVIERIEAAYPQLKPGTDEYDKDLVAEVLDMQSAFVAKGHAPSAAMQKAVGYVVKPATGKQESATSVTPRVSAEEAADKVKEERATEQRKKNADAAGKQPAALANAGANSDAAGGTLDAKTAIKMPYDKFSALTEEELSRMRGDAL